MEDKREEEEALRRDASSWVGGGDSHEKMEANTTETNNNGGEIKPEMENEGASRVESTNASSQDQEGENWEGGEEEDEMEQESSSPRHHLHEHRHSEAVESEGPLGSSPRNYRRPPQNKKRKSPSSGGGSRPTVNGPKLIFVGEINPTMNEPGQEVIRPKVMKLYDEIKKNGGNEDMVKGWSTELYRRMGGETKGQLDIYFFDLNKTKYGSVRAVIKHLGLAKEEEFILPVAPPAPIGNEDGSLPASVDASTTTTTQPTGLRVSQRERTPVQPILVEYHMPPSRADRSRSSASNSNHVKPHSRAQASAEMKQKYFSEESGDLAQPIKLYDRVTLMSVGKLLFPQCVSKTQIFPVGYYTRVKFLCPFTPTRLSVFECKIVEMKNRRPGNKGVQFKVTYIGPVEEDEAEKLEKAKKQEILALFEDEDGSDLEDSFEEVDKKVTKKHKEEVSLKPTFISKRENFYRMAAVGGTPNDAWHNLVKQMENKYHALVELASSFVKPGGNPNRFDPTCVVVMDSLIRTIEAQQESGERMRGGPYRGRFFLNDEALYNNLGDYMFGFMHTDTFQLLEGVDGLVENAGYIFRCERSRKPTSDDLRLAREGEAIEDKLLRAERRLYNWLVQAEDRAEKESRMRMRAMDKQSSLINEKSAPSGARRRAPNSGAGLLVETVAKEAPGPATSHESNVERAMDRGEIADRVKSDNQIVLETIEGVLELAEKLLSKNRKILLRAVQEVLTASSSLFSNQSSFAPHSSPSSSSSFDPLPTLGEVVGCSASLFSGWDFIVKYCAPLGLIHHSSFESFLPSERKSAVNNNRIDLRVRAPYSPCIQLNAFLKCFRDVDMTLLGPIHAALLRAACSTIKDSQAHLYSENNDEGKKAAEVYYKCASIIERDPNNLTTPDLLVCGSPITQATWFTLVKIVAQLVRIGEKESVLDEEEKKEFSSTSAMTVCERTMQGVREERKKNDELLHAYVHHCVRAALEEGDKMDLTSSFFAPGDAAGGEVEEEFDYSQSKNKNASALPLWVEKLRAIQNMATNRGNLIKKSIEEVLEVLPPSEHGAKRILTEALSFYTPNKSGKCRDRAMDAYFDFMKDWKPKGKTIEVDRTVFVRSMTYGEFWYCKEVITKTIGRLIMQKYRAELKEKVEKQLDMLEFQTFQDFLKAMDSFFQEVKARSTDNGLKDALAAEAAYQEALRDIAPQLEFGEPIKVKDVKTAQNKRYFRYRAEPAKEEDDSAKREAVALRRRLEMVGRAVEKEGFVSAVSADGALVISRIVRGEFVEEEVVVDDGGAALREEAQAEVDEEDELVRVLLKTDDYQSLSFAMREKLFVYLVNLAGMCPEVLLYINQCSIQRSVTKEKYGRLKDLQMLAAREDLNKFRCKDKREEKFLSMFKSLLSGHNKSELGDANRDLLFTLEKIGVEVKNKFLEKELEPVTNLFSFNLDRTLDVYENRPFCFGVDSFNHAFLRFASDGDAVYMVDENDRMERITGKEQMEKLLGLYSPPRSEEEHKLVENLKVFVTWFTLGDEEKKKFSLWRLEDPTKPSTQIPLEEKEYGPDFVPFGPHVGARVGINRKGHINAFIVAYAPPVPPNEQEPNGEPALWKAVHDDGDGEDFEGYELEDALRLAEDPLITFTRSHFVAFSDETYAAWNLPKGALARFLGGLLGKYAVARSFSPYDEKMFLDLKVCLICMEDAYHRGVLEEKKVERDEVEKTTVWSVRFRGIWRRWVANATCLFGLQQALALLEHFVKDDAGKYFRSMYGSWRMALCGRSLSQLACRMLALDCALDQKYGSEHDSFDDEKNDLRAPSRKSKLREVDNWNRVEAVEGEGGKRLVVSSGEEKVKPMDLSEAKRAKGKAKKEDEESKAESPDRKSGREKKPKLVEEIEKEMDEVVEKNAKKRKSG